MSYTYECLQLGSNDKRVPGYEDLVLASPPYLFPTGGSIVSGGLKLLPHVPVKNKLLDLTVNPSAPGYPTIWNLVFTYDGLGGFYPVGKFVPAPMTDKAVAKSWYVLDSHGGPDSLVFTPFLIRQDGSSLYATASNFVDFNDGGHITTGSSINTDTLVSSSVTATVHDTLPEYSKVQFSTHAQNQGITITTTITNAKFDKIFVYSAPGSEVVNGNQVIVQKGNSCYALAVFRETITSFSKFVSTTMKPTIPEIEWPQIIADIITKGDIYEYLPSSVIASMEPETLKAAISLIGQRIEHLNKVKITMSNLHG